MIPERLIIPEIAEKYGRARNTIVLWRHKYDWPDPVGTRGRWDEFDADAVDQAVQAIIGTGTADADADPDELLDTRAAAEEAGLSPATVRADISKGRWPEPDDSRFGTRRWRRSTVREAMMARRPDKRRRARKEQS